MSESLSEIKAERDRINKKYKEAVAADEAMRKPLEDAINAVLPGLRDRGGEAYRYRKECAKTLAALHEAGHLIFSAALLPRDAE